MQIIEHARCADEHDTASGLTRAIGQGSCEEGLTGPRVADEERVYALVDEGDVVKRQIAGLGLLATRIEVEIEGVDGVDLGKTGGLDASVDRATHAALLLFVAQTMQDIRDGQVFLRGLSQERRDGSGHAGQSEPAQLLDQQGKHVVVLHDRSWSSTGGFASGGWALGSWDPSPGSRVRSTMRS